MRVLIAVVAGLTLTCPLLACPPVRIVRAAPVKVVTVVERVAVIEPIVVATFAAVPVVSVGLTPGYGYAPPPVAAVAPAAPDPAVAELRALVQELRQALTAGRTAAAPAVATPAPVATAAHAGVLQSRCARCHSDAAAKGNMRLFERSQLVKLSGDQVKAILAAVKGTATKPPSMPKDGKPLTDDEFSVLFLGILD